MRADEEGLAEARKHNVKRAIKTDTCNPVKTEHRSERGTEWNQTGDQRKDRKFWILCNASTLARYKRIVQLNNTKYINNKIGHLK